MPDFTTDKTFLDSFTYTLYTENGVVKSRNNKTGDIVSNANLDPLVVTILASGDPSFEVQPGTYNLSGSFAGWEIVDYTHAYLHPGTFINVPNAYTTYVWKATPTSGITEGAVIQGGTYSEQGATPGYNWFLIEIAPVGSNVAVMNCSFQNMNVEKCYCMVHLKTNGQSWANSNEFRSIWGMGPRYGVLFEHVGTYTAGLSGPNGNIFEDVAMQALTPGGSNNVIGGFIDIFGQYNTFSHCSVWDIANVSPGSPSMTIGANSQATLIVGGVLTHATFTDSGTLTTILDNWQGLYSKNTSNLKNTLNITIPASVTETFFNFTNTDATGDIFTLENSTTTAGIFGCLFRHTFASSAADQWTAGVWFQTLNKLANDIAASTPCNVISAHNTNNTLLTNRGILDIENKFTPCYTFFPSYADFTNKVLKNASGILQDPINKRTGSWAPGHGSTATTVGIGDGILAQHVGTGPGTNSDTWDTTEGLIANYATTTTASQTAGLVPPSAGVGTTRRAFRTKARTRLKIDNTTSTRYYFGFSSATTLSASNDTVVANGDSAIIVGFTSADTNYQVRTHAGSGTPTVTQFTGPIAKTTATNYKTIEIEWAAAGNPTITIDGVALSVSSDLPTTTTNLHFHAVAQNSSTSIRTHLLKGVWLEVDG